MLSLVARPRLSHLAAMAWVGMCFPWLPTRDRPHRVGGTGRCCSWTATFCTCTEALWRTGLSKVRACPVNACGRRLCLIVPFDLLCPRRRGRWCCGVEASKACVGPLLDFGAVTLDDLWSLDMRTRYHWNRLVEGTVASRVRSCSMSLLRLSPCCCRC